MAKPYTPEESVILKKDFLELFQSCHGAVYLTCRKMGIPTQTYQYWRLQDEEFKLACDEVREITKDHMEVSLVRDAIKKGGIDRIFFMKTQMKDRGYVERVETTGKDGDALHANLKITETEVSAIDRIKQQAIEEYKATLLADK